MGTSHEFSDYFKGSKSRRSCLGSMKKGVPVEIEKPPGILGVGSSVRVSVAPLFSSRGRKGGYLSLQGKIATANMVLVAPTQKRWEGPINQCGDRIEFRRILQPGRGFETGERQRPRSPWSTGGRS